MTLEDLRKELAAGTLRPAYLLAGSEPLLRDDALASLREYVLRDGPRDFNFDRIDGADATPAGLQDSIDALPVMAAHRLVVLREPEAARAGRGRALLDALAEAVPRLLASAGEVVLVVAAAKADRRAKWVKAFADAVVACEPPRGTRETVAFARAEAKRQGVKFEKGAAEMLAELTGPLLLQVRAEIAKAALLAGPGEAVTREHVLAGTTDLAEEPIWDLTDAIGEGRTSDALHMLLRMSTAGAPAPVVLGALASHFRKLIRVRSGASVAGPPFVVKKLKGQSGRYTPKRLLACLDAIHETDLAIKGSGALPPELALERLVLGLSA